MKKESTVTSEQRSELMERCLTIEPYLPNDASVIKRTDIQGNVRFYDFHTKRELRVVSNDLESELACLLDPLEIIEKALWTDEQMTFANTITTVRQNIHRAISEMFLFVNNNIGEIEITSLCELQTGSIYRWGQCVDATLRPLKGINRVDSPK